MRLFFVLTNPFFVIIFASKTPVVMIDIAKGNKKNFVVKVSKNAQTTKLFSKKLFFLRG